jgi:hypothetical protein
VGRWAGLPSAPYPDDTGVRARQIDDPVGRPERDPDPGLATRRDGSECRWRHTLAGLGDPAAVPDEDRVKWTRWPP